MNEFTVANLQRVNSARISEPEAFAIIERLHQHGEFRVLRHIDIREGRTAANTDLSRAKIAVVVDVEATGGNPGVDVVIELAVRQLFYDEAGRILEIGPLWFWREDPGRLLDPRFAKLTGISDEDLTGQKIDTAAAMALFRSADVIVADDASFTRKLVEHRLPEAAGLAWASTSYEIDWQRAGYDGRDLGRLLMQAKPGYFHTGYCAKGDVDAIVQLLQTEMPDGRTALCELVDTMAARQSRQA